MDIRADFLKLTAAPSVTDTLMWVSDYARPGNVSRAIGSRYHVVNQSLADNFWDKASAVPLVIFHIPGSQPDPHMLETMLGKLAMAGAIGVVLLDDIDSDAALICEKTGRFFAVDSNISPEQLSGRIDSLADLQPLLAQAEAIASQAESSSEEKSGRIDQMEEEMRMAARLQRDFLPQTLPQVANTRFSVVFRPAGWVSGDIYEVSRIDEDHVGFYVADAVGHGLPAALLTMFIKKALPTKAIISDSYRIIQPAEALGELNDAICEQKLSSCQFCSAFYGILNCRTLELKYCRGGHPEPVLLRAGGKTEFLTEGGSLLGVFDQSEFAQGTVQLASGDKLVVYSDGAEDVFRNICPDGRRELLSRLQDCRRMDSSLMSLHLAGIFDDHIGPQEQMDDITALILAAG